MKANNNGKKVFVIAIIGGLAAAILCAVLVVAALYVIDATSPTPTPISWLERRAATCQTLKPVYRHFGSVPAACSIPTCGVIPGGFAGDRFKRCK